MRGGRPGMMPCGAGGARNGTGSATVRALSCTAHPQAVRQPEGGPGQNAGLLPDSALTAALDGDSRAQAQPTGEDRQPPPVATAHPQPEHRPDPEPVAAAP